MKVNYSVLKYVVVLLLAISGLIMTYQVIAPPTVNEKRTHVSQKSAANPTDQTLTVEEPDSTPPPASPEATTNPWWDTLLVKRVAIVVSLLACVGIGVAAVYLYTKTNAPLAVNRTQGNVNNESFDDEHVQKQWYKAVIKGDRELLETLYNKHSTDIDINAKNEHGATALLYSAFGGRLACVEFLCSKGANIHERDNVGATILMRAAEQGHIDVVKYLVSKSANIHAVDENKNTVLLWSAYKGHLDCIKYLVAQNANIEHKNKHGATALLYSAFSGKLACVKYLSSLKVPKIDARDNVGATALMWAAEQGRINVIRLLVTQGANVYLADDNGNTALKLARKAGKQAVVHYLSSRYPLWYDAYIVYSINFVLNTLCTGLSYLSPI